MSLLTDTKFFADVLTGHVLLNTARTQLKSFVIIYVVIDELDQQFVESIAGINLMTVFKFLLDAIVEIFCDFCGLYLAALLYSDDQPQSF